MFKYSTIFIAFVVSILFSFSAVSCTTNRKLARTPVMVLHTNDTHSQVEPLLKRQITMGGVVERNLIIDSLRALQKPLLLLDAGDFFQGTPYFNLYGGEVEIELMNRMGYDAVTLGNHEFDNGMEALSQNLAKAKFAVVQSNYNVAATPLAPYIKEYILFNKGGYKIAVIGLGVNPDKLIAAANWKGIVYKSPIAVADSLGRLLKSQGADCVIALSHLGYTQPAGAVSDSLLAVGTTYIDMIVGGHSHTTLSTPVTLKNKVNKGVRVVQTGKSGLRLGQSIIDPAKPAATWPMQLLPVVPTRRAIESPIATYVSNYKKSLDTLMTEKLCYSIEPMSAYKPQSLLANWSADALLAEAQRLTDRKIDFAVLNVGGLRAAMPQGVVTLGDIFRIFTFENALSFVQLDGKTVKQLFQNISFAAGGAVSGTVTAVLDGKGAFSSLLIGGNPVDDNALYWVATIDYLADGNDGFSAFSNARERENTTAILRDLMVCHLRRLTVEGKQISAQLDNRIQIESK